MKNIPIIGKFLLIIGLFAAFVVGAALYATGKMRSIDDTYSDLSDHQGAANIALARASRSIWAVRGGIAELLIASSAEDRKNASAVITTQRAQFVDSMDVAAGLLPDWAEKFKATKAMGLQVVDEACARSVRLARSSYQAAPDVTLGLRLLLKSESMRRTEEFADVGPDQASR